MQTGVEECGQRGVIAWVRVEFKPCLLSEER